MAKNVPIYKVDGSVKGEITLPAAFDAALRTDLIRKAVNIARLNRRQPYGVSPEAGRRHSVESWGPGRGVSRVPRLKQGRRAAFMPGSRGGRRAHPPKVEKNLVKRINKKEKRVAFHSALSGTADRDTVAARGHRIADDAVVPLVVDDAFANISATKDMIAALEALGLGDDLTRARDGVHVRAGKGKRRGRRYRGPRSVLIVTHDPDRVLRAAGNLPGVDVTTVPVLNTEDLAPGGDPGRLVVFTEAAVAQLAEKEAVA